MVWGLDPCSPPVGRRNVFRDVFCVVFASLIPCLWGKLQNLVRFAAHTSPCLWGNSKPQSLLLLWRRRAYGGSCKTSFWRRRVYGESCKTSLSASPLASPCLWGKLQNLVRFAALTSPCLWGKLQNLSSTGKCFGASFVVHSSTGNDFVQTL